jgi:DNA-binding GntR family transcriptional regulator
MANPMYRQIAEDLRQQIESGHLSHGSQLPNELELRERYNASRNTVRDAIKWLTNLGLVETRPGQGTFVTEDIDPFVTALSGDPTTGRGGHEGPSYLSEVSASKRMPSSSPVQVEIQQASAEVATSLRIGEGAEVISRHERRYIDGTPWSLQTSFYPMEFTRRMSFLHRELSGSFTLLGGITSDTLPLSPDRSEDNFLQLGARNTFTYSHELSHQVLCGDSDRYRQVIVQTAKQLLMSFAEEAAEHQDAALRSILIILYALAYRISVGICSILLFAAVTENLIRTLMAHRNSREPAYLPISRLPLCQSPAGVALAH